MRLIIGMFWVLLLKRLEALFLEASLPHTNQSAYRRAISCVKSWYEGGSGQVKLDGRLSKRLLVGRGVKQGLVLPPALVMVPLLQQLQASDVGLTVNRLYAGGFLHADDIKTLATSEESLKRQIDLVKCFADQNLLNLNATNMRLCCSQTHTLLLVSYLFVKSMEQWCQQGLWGNA